MRKMYTIYLEDIKTKKRFTHKEYSPYLFKKFMSKIAHSNKLKLLYYTCY